MRPIRTNSTIHYLNLFSASGTLVCCVLPITLVSLGAGSAMAMLAIHVPGLIWLSANKSWVFGAASIMLIISGINLYLNRGAQSCPTDPEAQIQCRSMNQWNGRIYALAVIMYLTGISFAFILPKINA